MNHTASLTPDQQHERQYMIDDLLRVEREHPDEIVSRESYRDYGAFKKREWRKYWERFSGFRAAAGLEPRSRSETQIRNAQAKVEAMGFGPGPMGPQGPVGPTGPQGQPGSGVTPTAAEPSLFDKKPDAYLYNKEDDTYLIYLDGAFKSQIILSGVQVRAMRQAYSNWAGKPQPAEWICKHFGIMPEHFKQIRRKLDFTHTHEPFTAEQVMESPVEELVQNFLQQRREAVYQAIQDKKWDDTKKNATKWVNFEQNTLNEIITHINSADAPYHAPILILNKPQEEFCVLYAPLDLHYGKYAWIDETGNSFNREEARSLLIEHTETLMRQVAKIGRPAKTIIASASDWMHIDNQQGQTTRGTQQDTDGTRNQIIREAYELARDHVELLLQVGAPIEWLKVNGNHDYDSAITLMLWLEAYYRADDRVSINPSPMPRQYTTYGRSILGFSHGDSVKPAALHATMTSDAKEMYCKTDFAYYFTGHLHHRVEQEINGITHYQLSSLSGADRWHSNKGYITSGRAAQAFVFSSERGLVNHLISPVIKPGRPLGIKLKG